MKASNFIQYLSTPREFDETARAGRERRNLRLPVSRLPAELLIHIFEFFFAETSYRRRIWLAPTHVCRRWRTVSIAAPLLWRHIIQQRWAGHRWTFERMARAQGADIIYQQFGQLQHFERNYIAKHLAHFETLDLTCPGCSLHELGLGQSAPRLRALAVRGEGTCDRDLPDNLFGGHAPRLRELTLRHVLVPRAGPVLAHLTTLRITLAHPLGPRVPPPTLAHILDLLRTCAALENFELDLMGILSARIIDDAPSLRIAAAAPPGADAPAPLRLPKMKRFVLKAAAPVCVAVLRRIETYPVSFTDVYIEREHAAEHAPSACITVWSRWAAAFSAKLAGNGRDPKLALVTTLDSEGRIELRTSSRGVDLYALTLPAAPHDGYDRDGPADVAWLDGLLAAAPPRAVVACELRILAPRVSAGRRFAGLCALAGLRTLELHGAQTVVVDVLRRLAAARAVPQLEELRIRAWPKAVVSPDGDVYAAIDAFRRARQVAGRSVRIVEVKME